MAGAAADPKAALLSEELKEFALTLPTTIFPKTGNGNFFCALCSQLAFDSWKLLCCNKSICTTCHAKLEFPTTCPLCDHTPLEADTCTPNKSLRNTMRAWLQKAKKKEDAKKAETPTVVEDAPGAAETPQPGDSTAENPMESVSGGLKNEDGSNNQTDPTIDQKADASARAGSAGPESKEQPTSLPADESQQPSNSDLQHEEQNGESGPAIDENSAIASTADTQGNSGPGNEAMFNQMNGMQGQYGYGFNPNQGNFNGMGWNGMMNGMPNMMGGANWNMNSMDFNNMNAMSASNMPNGMYGGFGGNMGMPGMNDMSAMQMMNYGGGFGNDWQGGMNGTGYGNFNGYNQMGGYNQSGAQYPQMMNQYPKNNFPNQNRFQANGSAFPQKNNRRGSQGNFGNQNGSGSQHSAQSRPESRTGPHNRDGESPAGHTEAAPEASADVEHAEDSVETTHEGKTDVENTSKSMTLPSAQLNDSTQNPNHLTGTVEDGSNGPSETGGLNQIQTVDSDEPEEQPFDQSSIMMNEAMVGNQGYPLDMMNGFPNQGYGMGGPYGGNMGYNQSKYGHNNYGHQGGFNAAYGAATVLTGEPRGVGVEGAPTGPRAMREGRPNTGFSSRGSNGRFNGPPNVSGGGTAKDAAAPASPPRKGRGSPERDETLRVKDKSPSRSRSRSRPREGDQDMEVDRARSEDRESQHHQRDQSTNSTDEQDEQDPQKDRRHNRSSRHDDEFEIDLGEDPSNDYDDRHRDENRGDRTRSTSAASRHRSRREKEKDKHRSSRSHRDRSREHRRRHRSRSLEDDKFQDDADTNSNDMQVDSSGRRKSRAEKDKYRDRSRERERERSRDRDRDRDRDRRDRRDREYERDYDKEKDRSRDKDRDRKRSRRDRDGEDQRERDHEDEKHRSSRRSRKERDRERNRKFEAKETSAARGVSPPLNAPTGPSADGFSIRGFSKTKREAPASTSRPMPPPPTGPRALQPPKGPAADRDRRDSREHKRNNSHSSSVPLSPSTPVDDHYANDRDRHDRDRVLQTLHGRVTGRSNTTPNAPAPSSSRPALSSKRSRDDFDRGDSIPADDSKDHPSTDRENRIPTGPAAHRDKRRKSGANGDDAIANLFSGALRKRTRERRGGVKMEGDAERDLERGERDRDRRW
ncbi:hypothetical protein B0J11DRAFT_539738 [Dendryphion nanum]|uniref:RING-type domain-containing protein n=1 Tax=Dendryphion nanum TaxID=256645 RepID=A0A9P9D7D0_9PLEO|nr:hypothetical protein B0J11DRAFT_539738 [Dendryphion nanum]